MRVVQFLIVFCACFYSTPVTWADQLENYADKKTENQFKTLKNINRFEFEKWLDRHIDSVYFKKTKIY